MTPKQAKQVKNKLLLRITELRSEILEYKLTQMDTDLIEQNERILQAYEKRMEQFNLE